MKRVVVAFFTVLAVCSMVWSAPITLDASRDALLQAGNPGSNDGNGGKCYIGAAQGVTSADTVVMGWDFTGITLGPGEYVQSASLKFYSSGSGSNFTWDLGLYPLKKTWQEGIGAPSGGYGSTNYPWGPASVGDATATYQVVTETVADATGWIALATAGTAWDGLGASGDADSDKTKPMTTGQWIGDLVSIQMPLGNVVPLSADGLLVIEDWITGALDNNGVVMIVTGARAAGAMHLATREYMSGGNAPGPYAAELTFEIVPEPASMVLLGLGGLGVLIRRRRR